MSRSKKGYLTEPEEHEIYQSVSDLIAYAGDLVVKDHNSVSVSEHKTLTEAYLQRALARLEDIGNHSIYRDPEGKLRAEKQQ